MLHRDCRRPDRGGRCRSRLRNDWFGHHRFGGNRLGDRSRLGAWRGLGDGFGGLRHRLHGRRLDGFRRGWRSLFRRGGSLLHGGRLSRLRRGGHRTMGSRATRSWSATSLRRGSSRCLHIKHLLTFTLHDPLPGDAARTSRPVSAPRSVRRLGNGGGSRVPRPPTLLRPNIASRRRYVIGDGQGCQRKSRLTASHFQLKFRACRVRGRTIWPCQACPSSRRRPLAARPCG